MDCQEFLDLSRKFSSDIWTEDKFDYKKIENKLQMLDPNISQVLTNFHLKKIIENDIVRLRFNTFLVLKNKDMEVYFNFWVALTQFLDKLLYDSLLTNNERNSIYSTMIDKYLNKASKDYVKLGNKKFINDVRDFELKLRANPNGKHLKIPGIIHKIQRMIEEKLEPELRKFYESHKEREHIHAKLKNNECFTGKVSSKYLKAKIVDHSKLITVENKLQIPRGKWEYRFLEYSQKELSVYAPSPKKLFGTGSAKPETPKYKFMIEATEMKVIKTSTKSKSDLKQITIMLRWDETVFFIKGDLQDWVKLFGEVYIARETFLKKVKIKQGWILSQKIYKLEKKNPPVKLSSQNTDFIPAMTKRMPSRKMLDIEIFKPKQQSNQPESNEVEPKILFQRSNQMNPIAETTETSHRRSGEQLVNLKKISIMELRESVKKEGLNHSSPILSLKKVKDSFDTDSEEKKDITPYGISGLLKPENPYSSKEDMKIPLDKLKPVEKDESQDPKITPRSSRYFKLPYGLNNLVTKSDMYNMSQFKEQPELKLRMSSKSEEDIHEKKKEKEHKKKKSESIASTFPTIAPYDKKSKNTILEDENEVDEFDKILGTEKDSDSSGSDEEDDDKKFVSLDSNMNLRGEIMVDEEKEQEELENNFKDYNMNKIGSPVNNYSNPYGVEEIIPLGGNGYNEAPELELKKMKPKKKSKIKPVSTPTNYDEVLPTTFNKKLKEKEESSDSIVWSEDNSSKESSKEKDDDDDSSSFSDFEVEPNLEQLNTSSHLQQQKRREMSNWNERFQAVLEKIKEDPVRIDYHLEMIILSEDFSNCAINYGKIIISEVSLEYDKKTIKPLKNEKGEKYIVANIFFKFAVDDSQVYGNHKIPTKLAGHELKGLKAYFQTRTEGLCFPLCTIIDFKGWRLIAYAILPINTESIKYGSDNEGLNIYNDDVDLAKLMLEASEQLNLKPHLCKEKSSVGTKLIASACDVEGYLGKDERFYLIDLARVFPCVKTSKETPFSERYQLMRPEFVQTYHIQLCSDAYSKFTDGTKDHLQHAKEIDIATKDLLEITIPNFTSELIEILDEELSSYNNLNTFSLTKTLHSFGINCRYLSNIIQKIGSERKYYMLILAEVVARVLKNNLNHLFQDFGQKFSTPTDQPYRIIFSNYLNLVFANNSQSEEFWKATILKGLEEQFLLKKDNWELFPEKLKKEIFAFKNFEDKNRSKFDARFYIFKRLLDFTQIKVNSVTQEMLSAEDSDSVYLQFKIFDWTDFEGLGVRTKVLDVVSSSKAFIFRHRGKERESAGFFSAAIYLYQRALESIEVALESNPLDPGLLGNCALVHFQIEKLSLAMKSEKKNLNDLVYTNTPRLRRANACFVKCIKLLPDVSNYINYAQFLEVIGKPKEAELHYLFALSLDPNNLRGLNLYGNFLQINKKPNSEAFLSRYQYIGELLNIKKMQKEKEKESSVNKSKNK